MKERMSEKERKSRVRERAAYVTRGINLWLLDEEERMNEKELKEIKCLHTVLKRILRVLDD